MSNRRCPSASAPGGGFPDLLEDLRLEGHLTQRQWRAGVAFIRELQRSHGSSAGLVMTVTERVDVTRKEALQPPGGASITALDQRLKTLRPHERQLVAFLVTGREQARGTLSDLGRISSGYQTQKTARAYAVGRVAGLLDTLADGYFPAG